jgi:NADPH:quinone reductase-like Zn-dependent oxidoreductase
VGGESCLVGSNPTLSAVKAIVYERYGGPEVLELREVEKPAPAADEVLVGVRASSANPADWHYMRGVPYLMRPQAGLRAPRKPILGRDVAGVVESVGSAVTRLNPGDEVFGEIEGGAFAEFVAISEDLVDPKPASLSFEEAAAVPLAAVTALQGLRDHGQLEAGQRLLVIGAGGGVGIFAVQIAKEIGAEVTGVCSTSKVDTVRSLGADHVIDYTAEDFTAGPERFDVVLQLGGRQGPAELRRVLKPKGILLLSSGESDGRVVGPMWRMFAAAALSPFASQKLGSFLAKTNREDLAALRALVEAGKLRPVIDRTLPLHEVPEAIRQVEDGHTRGKIAIRV